MKRFLVMALVVVLAVSMLALPAAARDRGDRDDDSLSAQLLTSFLSGIFVDINDAGRLDKISGSFFDAAGIITVQMASGTGNIQQANSTVSLGRVSALDLAATTAIYLGGLEVVVGRLGEQTAGLGLIVGPVVVGVGNGTRTDLISNSFGEAAGILTVQMAAGAANTQQSTVNVRAAF